MDHMDWLTIVTAASSVLVVVFIAGQYSARISALEEWRRESKDAFQRFEHKLDVLLERRVAPRHDDAH